MKSMSIRTRNLKQRNKTTDRHEKEWSENQKLTLKTQWKQLILYRIKTLLKNSTRT